MRSSATPKAQRVYRRAARIPCSVTCRTARRGATRRPLPTARSTPPWSTVRGTATGRLYGAPATKRSFEASFFDYVRIDDGHIIERVQQADVLAQMGQLYGKALGLVGLDAMFLRL